MLDGVYSAPSPHTPPRWHEAESPTDADVARLCCAIRDRVVRLLHRRGLLDGSAESDEEPTLLSLIAAASVQGRSAFGPEIACGVDRVGVSAETVPGPAVYRSAPLCAEVDGFSLHAGVCVAPGEHNRERLEHLCRYVARPALATERLCLSRRGNVLLRLRRPWRDGTTHLVFEPLAFIERLAALIPRPRVHQLTYHGVLAPAAALRSHVVPGNSSRRLRGAGFAAAACDARYSWPELMKRVFGTDVLRCHRCRNRRQIVALITQPDVIRRILEHLGLPADPPSLAPARSPPQTAIPF